ncbi:MAG: Rho termination factor N-terminal domain-containing protein [Psychrobacillus sp.]
MMLRRYHKKKAQLPPTRGYGVPIDTVHPRSLVEYTISELKALCKERGLKGYSKFNEAELIALLSGEIDA